ncbi:hypothetical protein ACEWY4_013058 [Coilia grayii]|uniref:Uncharacterized protein n=1 Tax=Coilia grayii TaxID=363190 RepID=A0ABD1JVD4_9TELE
MEESGFPEFRQWLQDQLATQDQRTEPEPPSPRTVAWNEDSSEDDGSAACAISTASAVSNSDVITLTDEQKEILKYTKEEKTNREQRMTGALRKQKRVTERRTGQGSWQHKEEEPLGAVAQWTPEKPFDLGGHDSDTAVQELDTEEFMLTEHLLARQSGSEDRRETCLLNMTKNGSSLAETEKLMFVETHQSRRAREEGHKPHVSLEQAQEPEKQGDKHTLSQVDEERREREQERMKELIERVRGPHKGMRKIIRGDFPQCSRTPRNDDQEKELEYWRRKKEERDAEKAQRNETEEGHVTGLKDMSDEAEQAEESCSQAGHDPEGHHQQQMGRRRVKRLVREKQRELDQKVEIESKKQGEELDLGGDETDSQCQQEEKRERQTDVQEEEEERSPDTYESDSPCLTDTEEKGQYSLNHEQYETQSSEYSTEVPDREKSVRRRLLGWVNDHMKKRFEKKFERTMQREAEEGHAVYVSGKFAKPQQASLSLGLSRICTRAEREQEKRKKLCRAEFRRQLMESRWLQWERDRRQMKEEKKAREEEERSQAQLAWILQQNEKADRNLDRYNGSQTYTGDNRHLKKEIIGWSRKKD